MDHATTHAARVCAAARMPVWFTRLDGSFQVVLDHVEVEARGLEKDGHFHTVRLQASTDFELEPEAMRWFERALVDGEYRAIVSENLVVLGNLPAPARARLEGSIPLLTAALDRVGGLLRWRYHLAGDHASPRIDHLVLAAGGRELELPIVPMAAVGDHEAHVEDDAESTMGALLRDDCIEPIGHELLREARANRLTHPRSALVIGCAAAESGFKEFAAKLVPEVGWLLEKSPAPPLAKMMKDYLPQLPVRRTLPNGDVYIPLSLRKVVAEAVEHRNLVAHTGRHQPTLGEVERFLVAVNDLLYLLDYYLGQEWAIEFVSQQTRTALTER